MPDNEMGDRIATLERELLQLKKPPPDLHTAPRGAEWVRGVEIAQTRAREARIAAEKQASAERREQAERDLPELLKWHARVQALDDQLAALRAERAKLDERETALGWERTRVNAEPGALTPEASQLLLEATQGRAA